MKNITVAILLFFIGFTVHAQANIEFKSDVVDYGKIAYGSDGVRTFTFSNTGDQNLIIKNVDSSCGCTIPTKPKDPIAPGKTGVIKVKYDTNRVGPIRKIITVYSNAAKKPTYTLRIKGRVLPKEKA